MAQGSPGCALVSAASGGLGRAVLSQLLDDPGYDRVIAVSRTERPTDLAGFGERLLWVVSDYSEQSLAKVIDTLGPLRGTISRVCICNGVLHGDNFRPEKRLEEISADTLQQVMQANAIVPVLWLKGLHPLLAGDERCIVAVLSARVGSIGDNGLGGWYSYRASKAALNMLLKTAAIEYARRAPNVKLIAFHPGTTDTPLSKPFQAAVPRDKLFTPDFVAGRLVSIMDHATVDGELSYLDWDNKPIEW